MNRVKIGSGWEFLLRIAEIEGCSRAYTWNPAVGCDGVGCAVRMYGKCWAEMMAKRLGYDWTPHLIPERLDEPSRLRERSVIQVVSMGDLFAQKEEDTKRILDVVESCSRHVFTILTKQPITASRFNPYPSNVWFGVTVNRDKDEWRLSALHYIKAKRKFCVFEPLYSNINYSDLSSPL